MENKPSRNDKWLEGRSIEELQHLYDTGMLPWDVTQDEFTRAWDAALERRSREAKQTLIDKGLFY